jgi:pimeloyl-ACP methyl ester carboxylesterase
MSQIESAEYWAQKEDGKGGEVKLYVYRKRTAGLAKGAPVLFLVHGSSASGRNSFDLNVPGRSDYSLMNHFAGLGYDVWTVDHEGYGRSDRTDSHSGIASGAQDLAAAMQIVERESGQNSVFMYGGSSGALRAALYAHDGCVFSIAFSRDGIYLATHNNFGTSNNGATLFASPDAITWNATTPRGSLVNQFNHRGVDLHVMRHQRPLLLRHIVPTRHTRVGL